jgi:Reverse transcriptase (RNA-dependent DNA polymerase)
LFIFNSEKMTDQRVEIDVSYTTNKNMDFNILYTNIHSLRNKLDELNFILTEYSELPEAVVICETWLADSMAKFCNIPGYSAVHNCRNDGYAGLSVFVKDGIEYDIKLNKKLDRNQIIMLHFKVQNFTLLSVYRDSAERAPTQFFRCIDRILEKQDKLFVVGDFNIDLFDKTRIVSDYLDLWSSNNFRMLNRIREDDYTYSGPHGISLIDHFITDMTDAVYNIDRIPTALTDHCLFKIGITTNEETEKSEENEEFFEKTDFRAVNKSIEEDMISQNVIDFSTFLAIFLQIIKKCTHLSRKAKTTKKDNPWMCTEIKVAISWRDFWYKRHKQFPNSEFIKNRLKNSKNFVTKVVRGCKNRYYSSLIANNLRDSRKTWGVLNFLMFNKDRNKKPIVKEIQDTLQSGATTSNTLEICNIFNSFFTGIAEHLRGELFRKHNFKTRIRTMTTWVSSTILEIPTDFHEINNIIRGLKNNSASGIDLVCVRLLKYCKTNLAPFLVEIINHHVNNGIFPAELKVARTVPIYKSGVKKLPANYRPISVLSNFAKIFEKIIYSRLVSFYERVGFINENQFGFVKKSSTVAAALNFVTAIRDSMNRRLLASAIFIDISKAFDCVDHEILLDKLYKSGVRGKFHKLLKSYLSDRQQVVKIDKTMSQREFIRYGIPQGSVLGPLLFSVFVNDIFELKLRGKLQLYADDAVLTYSHKNPLNLYIDMQHDLNLVSDWFYNNCLTVNGSKSKFIIFKDCRKVLDTESRLFINGEEIERVDHIRYLGLMVDSQLNWDVHVNYVKNKIASFAGVLHRIKYMIPIQSRLNIFYAHVYSHVLYMNVVWTTACQFRMDTISRLVNKGIRAVFYEDYKNDSTHTIDLFNKHKILTVKNLAKYETVSMVYKIKHNLIKHDITLETNEGAHNYELRNNRDFRLEKIWNNYGRFSISHHGVDLYNKLPTECKNAHSFNDFRKKVKDYFLTCQTAEGS